MSAVRSQSRFRKRGEKPLRANRPLTSRQRNELPDRAYALPTLRKYPLYKIDPRTRRLKASRGLARSAKGYATKGYRARQLTRAQYLQIERAANKIMKQTEPKPRAARASNPAAYRKGTRVSMAADICTRVSAKTGKALLSKQRHYGNVLGVYARYRDNQTGKTFPMYRVRLDSGTVLAVHPKCMRRTTKSNPADKRRAAATDRSLLKPRRVGQRMTHGMTPGQDHRTHPMRGPVAINPPRRKAAKKRRGRNPAQKKTWWKFQLRGVRKVGDAPNEHGYGGRIGTAWFEGTERQSAQAAANLVGASYRRKKIHAVMRDGPFAKKGR